MLPERNASIEKDFPAIVSNGYKITSPQDPSYNCIAWAVDDDKNFWWPHPDGFWPEGIEMSVTVRAFVEAYKTRGYEVCDGFLVEEGYEKVVIYVDEYNAPTHAAKQISENEWSSKIGKNHDIKHTLEGLVSTLYGKPAIFLKRTIVSRI